MFYQASLRLAVEAIQQFGPHDKCFHMVMGEHRWYIIRCYLAINNASTIESVVEALRERPQGFKLMVTEYFNAAFVRPEGADWDK